MKHSLLTTNKIPQALIVRQAPLSNFNAFFKGYLKTIVCTEHGCDKCVWCQKINNNQYFDIAMFDAKQGLKLKEVLEAKDKISLGGLEQTNIRFFVIKNIEYGSKKVLNSLLKFIEEPPYGIYILLTTRNYDAILPTIKSRCYNIYLEQDEGMIERFAADNNLSPKQTDLLKLCFYDIEEASMYLEAFLNAIQIVSKLTSSDRLSYAYSIHNEVKKMSYQEINLILQIIKHTYSKLALKVNDIQNTLYLNPNKTLVFNEIYELLKGVK